MTSGSVRRCICATRPGLRRQWADRQASADPAAEPGLAGDGVVAALACSALRSGLAARRSGRAGYAAQRRGRLRGLNAAALQRMRDDLVFDLEPARRDFGYAPRAFRPVPEELGIGE
ncbi:hypothetical protein ADT26_10910 [Xanthomonas oryzae]|nr:hypothetical protein AXO1947_18400 [Xanthomonas oryzae pv. oryzae]KOR43846.1 hypothetical protein ADT26_10910 [Xanthomonas oryzae]AUI89306.1 hypothetical protein BVV16_02090 [Xanthomonas oryzae pv. oryzae]AUI92980.1 hypothetical protein BVV17_02090 [Xanthomonas oryzae pv. oryzae]AUI96653.1 hypothetical protein BVV18_02095 [Xanthomonas oryzae pv. oryzae]